MTIECGAELLCLLVKWENEFELPVRVPCKLPFLRKLIVIRNLNSLRAIARWLNLAIAIWLIKLSIEAATAISCASSPMEKATRLTIIVLTVWLYWVHNTLSPILLIEHLA